MNITSHCLFFRHQSERERMRLTVVASLPTAQNTLDNRSLDEDASLDHRILGPRRP
jgi:hypothetical protein